MKIIYPTASLLLEPAALINLFVIIAVPTLSNEVNEPSVIKRIINGKVDLHCL